MSLDEVPVLDTRASAEVYPRDLLLTGLADALPIWLKAGNRVLLTSRPYGLDEDGLRKLRLPQAPLEPLPEPLQDLFVARWPSSSRKAVPARRWARRFSPVSRSANGDWLTHAASVSSSSCR
jgi:hypothetical protein